MKKALYVKCLIREIFKVFYGSQNYVTKCSSLDLLLFLQGNLFYDTTTLTSILARTGSFTLLQTFLSTCLSFKASVSIKH